MRLAIAVLALLFADVASAQYSAAVLADSPVAYYRFEETSGTVAADSSGNANTGTYTNGPTLAQPGRTGLGLAVRFDGVDDFVDTPRTVAGDFSLELWVQSATPCRTGTNAFEGDGLLWSDVGGPGNDFVLACLNAHAAFFTGNPDDTIEGTTAINDGTWHHIVATRDQGGAKQVFVDGVLQATGTTNASLLDSNPRIHVGGNTLDDRYFTGLIDEVAYYTTVLTPAQIQAHFAAGTAPPAPVPATSPWTLAALIGALALVALTLLRARAA